MPLPIANGTLSLLMLSLSIAAVNSEVQKVMKWDKENGSMGSQGEVPASCRQGKGVWWCAHHFTLSKIDPQQTFSPSYE